MSKEDDLNDKALLSGILTAINDVIWCCTADEFKFLYINGACERVFGFSPEELIGKTGILSARLFPEDKEIVSEGIKQLFQSGTSEFRFRINHRDGTLKYILHKCYLINDLHGKPSQICGIATDISETVVPHLSKVEEILESITDAFFALDSQMRFTYINQECARLYQSDRELLLGKFIWDYFPKARQSFEPQFMDALKNQASLEFETLSPTIGRWVYVRVLPTTDGLAIYLRDITEQKKLKDEIEIEQQNRLALINNTSDMIWSFDRDYNLLSSNENYDIAIEKLTGKLRYRGQKAISDDFPPHIMQKWKGYYDRSFEGSAFKVIETLELDGNETYNEISFYPIRDKDQLVIGVSCCSRDITDQRKHLLRIQEQNNKLQEISWLQSHKVRGPLASILGLIDLINKQDLSDPLNIEIIEKLGIAALQLDEVVHAVVETTKV